MALIKNITAQKILDSNGHWTILTTIILDNGVLGHASVPSGHSVGKYEAKLVSPDAAIEKINNQLAEVFIGQDVSEQKQIDHQLISLDNTTDKSNLGANTILSVSLASFQAAANVQRMHLFDYLNQYYEFAIPTIDNFPTPLLNLINGGAHASNNLEFQSFMVSPASYLEYRQSLELGVTVYHKLKEILLYKNLNVDVGEEGGFAPMGLDVEQTCRYIVQAIIDSQIKAGTEMFLAIDVAASTFYNPPNYQTRGVLGAISAEQLRDLYVNLTRNYPILYLEDPFAEDAWTDWVELKKVIGNSVEIIGDDLTVTNPTRVEQAIQSKCISGVIIKTNQIGTLTEAVNVIKQAKENNLTVVMSHRSGETAEDTFIADLAVGAGANYIKAGAPARGERTSKYNRLLEIEMLIRNKNNIIRPNSLQSEGDTKMIDNTPINPFINPTGEANPPAPVEPTPDGTPVTTSAPPATTPYAPAAPTPSISTPAAPPVSAEPSVPNTPVEPIPTGTEPISMPPELPVGPSETPISKPVIPTTPSDTPMSSPPPTAISQEPVAPTPVVETDAEVGGPPIYTPPAPTPA